VDSWFWQWVSKRHSFWRVNLLGWLIFSIFSLVTYLAVYPSLLTAILATPFQLAMALLVTGLLHEFYRRPSIGVPFRLSTAAWMILLSYAGAGIHAAVAQGVFTAMDWFNPALDPLTAWSVRWKLLGLLYMGWSLAYFWFKAELAAREEQKRAGQAEQKARNLELQLLRSQLDPHFLFNSLNSIATEIRPHPHEAEEMVLELADYLRYSLDHRNQPLTSVAAEVDAMKDYLQIEKARLGNHLVCKFTIDPAAARQSIPSFVLQPLIENAVKHACRENDGGLRIDVGAKINHGALELVVRNPGNLGPEAGREEGVGLSTLKRRLDMHYPGRHSFSLDETAGTVQARLNLLGAPCFA
jgi:two-component system LytT family sensor kinase